MSGLTILAVALLLLMLLPGIAGPVVMAITTYLAVIALSESAYGAAVFFILCNILFLGIIHDFSD